MPSLYNIYPLLVLGGIIGMFSIIFIVAYATMKNKKEAIGFDRHMKDSEIIVRLLRYARPYLPQFLLVASSQNTKRLMRAITLISMRLTTA